MTIALNEQYSLCTIYRNMIIYSNNEIIETNI